ncbi:MAG: phage portal protein [Solobacterium sp.]|jgi:HK97 family phage portal protein|nr:phage portal protein [Solobacterium sp.]MCH4226776.1 phage portal protein [Solobacterium sp.]MCH4281895.1 phage portal protein [Solobacterium sp.]
MGVWKNLFTRKKKQTSGKETVAPFDINEWNYRSFNGSSLELDLIRGTVDALARNMGKLNLQAVMVKSDGTKMIDNTSDIAHVLKRPNKWMTQYDFMYKITSLYFGSGSNTVFIYPEYDGMGNLINLYPVNYRSFHLSKSANGNYIANFDLKYTRTYYCPLEDLIILRNHYTSDDMFGDPDKSLYPVCELINAQNEGIINGIKNSAIIRGILKAAQVIKEENMIAYRDQFVKDNLEASNNGGVMVVDQKYDYQSLDSKPYIVNPSTMEEAKKKVFDYFGVNEDFLTNSFDSAGYEAVYEGRLEPFAIMLTQALTDHLYTDREKGFGNQIEANMAKMKYQPMSEITAMITATNQLGLFKRNEYREMLGYSPLSDDEGGNEILTSLNYAKSKELSKVQGVAGNDGSDDDSKGENDD